MHGSGPILPALKLFLSCPKCGHGSVVGQFLRFQLGRGFCGGPKGSWGWKGGERCLRGCRMSFVNNTKDGCGTLVQSGEIFSDLLSVIFGLGILGRHQVVCNVT